MSNPVQQGASARDLMQPVFALAAAEVAWRCANPARYVSPETVSAVLLAGGAPLPAFSQPRIPAMLSVLQQCLPSFWRDALPGCRAVAQLPPPPSRLPAAPAWSWQVVRHRDRQQLAALKLATAAALRELLPHSPRDLQRSPVLAKLRMGGFRGAVNPADGCLRRQD